MLIKVSTALGQPFSLEINLIHLESSTDILRSLIRCCQVDSVRHEIR